MKISARLIAVAALGALAAPLAHALPEAEASAGRLILRHYADAIVTVRGILSLRVIVGDRTMPPEDNRVDVTGTVVAPMGLTVTSFNALDPQALFQGFKNRMAGQGIPMTLGSSELRELRLVLGDGTEVPARLVGKDTDRDLAFIVPADSGKPGARSFTCVNLANAPVTAQILGDYFNLSRASADFNRVPLVREVSVAAIVERPLRLFVVTTDSIGCPVFDPQGGVLGICVRYLAKGQPAGFVVIPSSDIIDAANQAAGM